ncbi:hypothetical protein HPB52_016859 [Rhipicephalus sanguineus]|uniref:Peptidase S1 domain-containing protein n=1 Tax=Rhipicephalus sanguineus TaxID=34632 RepID=A0A9D4QDV9_RHISA|nr:hypothetical protein HPB52_016859 [Rhipicephalus sanguineus]
MDLRAIVVLFVSCCISGLCAASFPYKPYCLACVPSNCGRPRDPWDLLSGRTYGGSNSTRGRYPWHVKLGKTDLDKESPTERTYAVYQRVLHPRWDPERDMYSYDLALLQLEREVDFSSANGYINTVCLPEPRVDAQGWLTLTSFGYDPQGECTCPRGRRNNLMQEVNIEKLRSDQCPLFKNKPYAFCGMGKKSGICTGDRGSPVVQMAPTGEFTLVGVANDYQCQPGGTDVYTQISFFLKFVCNIPIQV